MTPSRDSAGGLVPRRRVYWTIADERGRVIADGLTPPVASDREAIGWVLHGGPRDGTPPTIERDRVYRVRAGSCAATARGDELRAVDEAATLDELALMPEGGRYLHGTGARDDEAKAQEILKHFRDALERAGCIPMAQDREKEAARRTRVAPWAARLLAAGIDPEHVERVISQGSSFSNRCDVVMRPGSLCVPEPYCFGTVWDGQNSQKTYLGVPL